MCNVCNSLWRRLQEHRLIHAITMHPGVRGDPALLPAAPVAGRRGQGRATASAPRRCAGQLPPVQVFPARTLTCQQRASRATLDYAVS